MSDYTKISVNLGDGVKGETVFFDRILTDDEVRKVTEHLAGRLGLPTPADRSGE